MQSNVVVYAYEYDHILFYVVQIADFGMSRDLTDENYYITTGGRIPVRWTAPEVGSQWLTTVIWLEILIICSQIFPSHTCTSLTL